MASRKIAGLLAVVFMVGPAGLMSHPAGKGSPVPPPVGVSALRSAVLPGWGEFGLGKTKRARLFTKVEVVLWAALIQAGHDTRLYDARLRAFGTLHAGASFPGKDRKFITDVGNYMSLDDFNQAQQRLRQPDRVYRDPEIYGWWWDSDIIRKIGQFVIGGMILNRIVSVIDVTTLHRMRSSSSNLILYPLVDGERGYVGLGASLLF
ncbi:MAG: hypothetical protein ACE5LH_03850 [Fidelibacterota bacterium]